MHVWETGKVHRGFWLGDLRERDHLEYLGLLGMIILKWIFKKSDLEHGLLRYDSGYEQLADSCEYGNETSDRVKCGGIFF